MLKDKSLKEIVLSKFFRLFPKLSFIFVAWEVDTKIVDEFSKIVLNSIASKTGFITGVGVGVSDGVGVEVADAPDVGVGVLVEVGVGVEVTLYK